MSGAIRFTIRRCRRDRSSFRIFTRRLRRLSAVTLIVALILPMRFDFNYALAAQVLLVLWLASYEITYRREHRRAMEKEERISGEERGRYWRRYNDALFYSIPF